MTSHQPANQLAASFETLLARLQRECGITFPPERRPDMARATRLAMARSDEVDLERYVASVASGKRALDDVVDEITIRETYFFREPEQFAFLREVVVPELLGRRRDAPLRCWSAGCASGEEAYSLAILLEEMGLGAQGRIVGTDVSLAAIAGARAASYRPWSLRGEGAARVRPFLQPRGDQFVLVPQVRRRVVFSRLNLVDDVCPPSELGRGPGACDLVLCRNVLVYFERSALAHVVKKIYDSLAEGGWLFAASSDPPLGSLAPFFCVPTSRGTFYRKLADRPLGYELTPPPAVPPSPSRVLVDPTPLVSSEPASTPPRPIAVPDALSPDAPSPRGAASRYEAALLLIDVGRDAEAMPLLRQAIYEDGAFVTAHLALGLALARLGQFVAARRSFQTVLRLCERLPPQTPVPFTGGTSVAGICAVARDRLRALDEKRKAS